MFLLTFQKKGRNFSIVHSVGQSSYTGVLLRHPQSLNCDGRLEKFQCLVVKWIQYADGYNATLRQFKLFSICFQLIKTDLIFLWKLCNYKVEIKKHLTFNCLPTLWSNHYLFNIPSARKLQNINNFFIGAPRTANVLLKLMCCYSIISFDMLLTSFRTSRFKCLNAKSDSFSIDNPCTFYVKCFCKSCRS